MAKPTGKLTAEEEEAREAEPTGEAQDALAEVATSGARQPETRIHLVNAEGEEEFIFKAPPAVVDESFLQKKFGPGKYVMHTYAKSGRGRFDYVKGSRRTISIGKVKDGDAPPPAAVVRQDGDDDSRLMFKTQMLEMMKDQAESRNQSSLMMMQMMKMMSDSASTQMQAMTAVIQAIGNKPADNGVLTAILPALLNRPDPAEIAMKIAALAKNAEGPGSLEMILDVADRINRRQNGEDISFAGVLKDSLPQALELIGKMADRPAPAAAIPGPRAPIAQIAPAPPTEAPSTSQPARTLPPVTDEWTDFEPQINQLLGYAAEGADARDVAGMAMFAIPAAGKAQLREWLARREPDSDVWWFEPTIAKRFPQITAYPQWFAELCMEMRVRFELVDPDDYDDDGGELPARVDDEPAAPPKLELAKPAKKDGAK